MFHVEQLTDLCTPEKTLGRIESPRMKSLLIGLEFPATGKTSLAHSTVSLVTIYLLFRNGYSPIRVDVGFLELFHVERSERGGS